MAKIFSINNEKTVSKDHIFNIKGLRNEKKIIHWEKMVPPAATNLVATMFGESYADEFGMISLAAYMKQDFLNIRRYLQSKKNVILFHLDTRKNVII